mgnify:CR=1 FL=1
MPERLQQAAMKSLSVNPYALPNFIVGADAHIGPLGSCEFAVDFRKNGAFCRADVGIGPYKVFSEFVLPCKFRVQGIFAAAIQRQLISNLVYRDRRHVV